MVKIIGIILAVVGGILALIAPFLTASTITTTIGSLVRTDSRSWIEMSQIFYLCSVSGGLAILVGIAAQIRPKAIWGVLLAVLAIIITLILVMALGQASEVVGSSVLKAGIALGALWGEAPTSFEMVRGMGAYCLTVSIILLILAAPLVALRK